jgi:hypothetical protein
MSNFLDLRCPRCGDQDRIGRRGAIMSVKIGATRRMASRRHAEPLKGVFA